MKKRQLLSIMMAIVMAVSVFGTTMPASNVEAASQVKKISMSKIPAKVEVGKRITLKVSKKPKKAKGKLIWKSSNSKVARVSQKGVVKGIKPGKVKITVKLKNGKKVLSASRRVIVEKKKEKTVKKSTIKVAGLKVKEQNISLDEGKVEKMEITINPSNATNKKLVYTSSDKNVATVSADGVITAVAQGSCVITAKTTDGSNCSVSTQVTVTKKARPRAIITQDAEVDDQDSLIHILLYSNEIDIQGIVQGSSSIHWIGVPGTATPEKANGSYEKPYRWPGTSWMMNYLDAYAKVYPNLKKHDKTYPTPKYLKSITKIGNIGYEGEMDSATDGSNLIKKALLDNDERTLYLMAWGGPNTIARALKDVETEYKGTKNWESIRNKIIKKVVITACMEQDNTYKTYISEEWPEIKFVSCVQMGSYAYGWGKMPEDESKVTLKGEWMLKNLLRGHGALLDKYVTWGDGTYLEGELPEYQFGTDDNLMETWWGAKFMGTHDRYDFLSEGDSPTFFLLLDSGLRSLEDLTYGGFSGRYALNTTKKNSRGQQLNYWSPEKDSYINADGTKTTVESSWKYIDDIQNDFAARADWCVKDYKNANHAPKITVKEGTDIQAEAGEQVKLHAVTADSDGDYVTVKWSIYEDASTGTDTENMKLKGASSDTISFKVPDNAKSGETIHFVAQAKDDGEHTLTHYQQVIVHVK